MRIEEFIYFDAEDDSFCSFEGSSYNQLFKQIREELEGKSRRLAHYYTQAILAEQNIRAITKEIENDTRN